MIAGELRNKVDSVWTNFWQGGMTNPLEVIEQFTYLLFIKGLDYLVYSNPIRQTLSAELRLSWSHYQILMTIENEKARIYYWLKSQTHFLNALGRGAIFKEISKNIVENILVPIPALPQQQKIVELLDKVQALISKRKKQIHFLDKLIKSKFGLEQSLKELETNFEALMQKAFKGELFPEVGE